VDEALKARDGTGTEKAVVVSHAPDKKAFRKVYGTAIDNLKCTPILWSAGYFFHPDYINRSNRYFRRCGLSLSSFEVSMDNLHMSSLMSAPFQEGQRYTGMNLYVYKQPKRGLVMSSFQNFNVGNYSFQQMVWMANINRAPIYSISVNKATRSLQSGASLLGMDKLGNFNDCFNPVVLQKEDVMLVTYQKESRDYQIKLMWPGILFEKNTVDENGVPIPNQVDDRLFEVANHPLKRSWLIGKRGEAYVGVSVMGWDGKMQLDQHADLLGTSAKKEDHDNKSSTCSFMCCGCCGGDPNDVKSIDAVKKSHYAELSFAKKDCCAGCSCCGGSSCCRCVCDPACSSCCVGSYGYRRLALIVVVGTVDQYSSLQEFRNKRLYKCPFSLT
jgi:hypothetical protein